MRTKLFILILGLVVCGAAIALPFRNWVIVTPGASITAVGAAVTAKHLVIKHIMFSVQNACNMYFLSATSKTKVTPLMYFAANSGINTSTAYKPLDIVVPSGQGLSVWFNTSPGADIMVEYSIES